MTSWLIRFDVGDSAWLPTPRMVDKQFGVHAKHAVQQILVVILIGAAHRATCDIPHGQQALSLELFRISSSNTPKISNRMMPPQQFPIRHLVQPGNADAVLPCLDMLGHNVHGNLGQIHVRANTRCSGDTSLSMNVMDNVARHLLHAFAVGA